MLIIKPEQKVFIMRKLYIVNSKGVASATQAMQALKDVGVMVNGDTWYSMQSVRKAVKECHLGSIYTKLASDYASDYASNYADIAQCTLVIYCAIIKGYMRLHSIEELGASSKYSKCQAMRDALDSLEYRHAMRVELYKSLIEQLHREEQ